MVSLFLKVFDVFLHLIDRLFECLLKLALDKRKLLLLLFVRVLLTWFPNVDWMRQPWSILRQITDPYLNLFRNLIPPIMGQIDFTPILGFMVLQFLAKVLSSDPSVGRF